VNSAKKIYMAHLLAADPEIASDIRFRVGPRGWNNDSTLVIVDRIGGAPEDDITVDNVLFVNKCYGGSDDDLDADAVADLLIDNIRAIYMTSNGKGRFIRGTVLNRFDSTDPDFECPVVTVMVEVSTQ